MKWKKKKNLLSLSKHYFSPSSPATPSYSGLEDEAFAYEYN